MMVATHPPYRMCWLGLVGWCKQSAGPLPSGLFFLLQKHDQLSLFYFADKLLHELQDYLGHLFAIQRASNLEPGVKLVRHVDSEMFHSILTYA